MDWRENFLTSCLDNFQPDTALPYGECIDQIYRRYYDPGNKNFLDNWMTEIFDIQYQEGGEFLPVGLDNPLQAQLYDICLDFPGMCEESLRRMCATYTAEDLAVNAGLTRWCGCHMRDTSYRKYIENYNIPVNCTPSCSRQGVIPVALSNGTPSLCTQAVCVIDDVNISLNRTTIGDITFDQICSGCGASATCACTISEVSIDAINATIGDVGLSQNCTGEINCYGVNPDDPDGPEIRIPCDSEDREDENASQYERAERFYAENRQVIIPLIIALVILAIAIILVVIKMRVNSN